MLDLQATFRDVKKAGAGWTAKCPAHDDRHASLSIGAGADGKVLLKCHAGCELDDVLAAAHLEPADLFPTNGHAADSRKKTIVATYDYRDETGALLYQSVRFDPKHFAQRRPNGADAWIWKLDGTRRVLYRLQELKGKAVVYVVEGEKDADRLWSLGLAATTNAGGAGKWTDAYTEQLRAAGATQIAVIGDNDAAGRAHARAVAVSCHAAGLTVKVITLPDVPEKGDVSDFLDRHPKGRMTTMATLNVPQRTSSTTTARSPHSGAQPALPTTSHVKTVAEVDRRQACHANGGPASYASGKAGA